MTSSSNSCTNCSLPFGLRCASWEKDAFHLPFCQRNKPIQRKKEEQPEAPPSPSPEEVLLAEIRDLLKQSR
jgi:hypothetical protein